MKIDISDLYDTLDDQARSALKDRLIRRIGEVLDHYEKMVAFYSGLECRFEDDRRQPNPAFELAEDNKNEWRDIIAILWSLSREERLDTESIEEVLFVRREEVRIWQEANRDRPIPRFADDGPRSTSQKPAPTPQPNGRGRGRKPEKRQAATAAIRQALEDGRLTIEELPGIPLEALAKEFGVSRKTISQALTKIEAGEGGSSIPLNGPNCSGSTGK
jgi:hypothetical protein